MDSHEVGEEPSISPRSYLCQMHVYEASLMGVVRILLWLFLISIVIRLIARLALPVVLKKADQAMRERQEAFRQNQSSPRKEGEVRVEKNKEEKKQVDGEYVDFVEIRD